MPFVHGKALDCTYHRQRWRAAAAFGFGGLRTQIGSEGARRFRERVPVSDSLADLRQCASVLAYLRTCTLRPPDLVSDFVGTACFIPQCSCLENSLRRRCLHTGCLRSLQSGAWAARSRWRPRRPRTPTRPRQLQSMRSLNRSILQRLTVASFVSGTVYCAGLGPASSLQPGRTRIEDGRPSGKMANHPPAQAPLRLPDIRGAAVSSISLSQRHGHPPVASTTEQPG